MKVKLTVLALAMAVTPQTRATIHRAFRAEDFEIVWTHTPAEAIEASAFREPELVVLDLGRSLQTGEGILDGLRTINPGAPVVVLAEPSTPRPSELAREGVALLQKPVEAAELATAAGMLLKASALPTLRQTGSIPALSKEVRDSELFRQMLQVRYDAPFDLAPSYRHWGINE